jgi:hypothetical protein
MTSAIQTLPSGSSAGLDFNYAVWSPGTTVQLSNVTWDAQYRDVVRFDDQTALDRYLTDHAGPTFSHMSYAKLGQPVRLNLPMNTILPYNYLRAFNPAQPVKQGDTPRAFYYFITGVDYLAPNTTQVSLQLDVWQTFGYGVTFGRCYVERGHVGVANVNNFLNNGKDFLTVPEGFDLGNEYNIQNTYSFNMTPAGTQSVMVVSNVDLLADPGTSNPMAPKLNTAKGSSMESLPNGASIYIAETIADFKNWLALFGDKPWVTQGIMSVTVIPNKGFFGITTTGSGLLKEVVGDVKLARNRRSVGPAAWRDDIVPYRYRHLNKFKVYPYSNVEMTSFTGTPLVLKPECIPADLNFVTLGHFAPPGPRMTFYPYGYNTSPDTVGANGDPQGTFYDGGEFLNMTTGIFDLPTFSILNNGYVSFMAANRNSISFQHTSADWSQQRALAGNQQSFDVANRGIDTSREMNSISNNAAMAQNALANQTAIMGAGVNVGKAVVGGALAGGGVGAVAGAAAGIAGGIADVAIGTNQRNMSTAINVGASQASNRAGNAQAQYANDTNKGLADWAAKGDYSNAIAGINAKVQDAKLTQPSVSGQVGGDAFLLANYKWGVDFRIRGLQSGVMASIGEYWLRYGYAINRFTTPPADLKCMSNFTFWKMKETYLTAASCPETFKNTIRGIFEKGVTVWNDPADMTSMDIGDNIPLAGVVL